jgi:sugar diacid utilization regulator
MAVEQAATMIALQFSIEHVISEREERLAENLLHDVLFSRDQPESTIRQRLSFLGHALATRYAVMVIDMDDFSATIEQQQWDEATVQSIKDSLRRRTRASLDSDGKSALVASTGDALVVLRPLAEKDTLETIRGHSQRLQEHLSDVSPHLTCSIGIGRICDQIGSAVQSYQDARLAASAARLTRGKGSITLYDELGIYSLLAKYENESLLQAYVEKNLGQLIKHDARHGSDLVKTLRVYLHSGNLRQTASELFIHINTVKYRLNKIAELTGADLKNADDVLNLHVSLKIADMDRISGANASSTRPALRIACAAGVSRPALFAL